MYKFLFSAILLVATNAAPRIYDGHDSSIKDFPYQVSIELMGNHFCGGSILNENWIITAESCDGIPGVDPKFFKVRSGTDKIGLGGSTHSIEKIVNYQRSSLEPSFIPINDIALMRVKEPFTFDETRQPIDLFSSGEKSAPGKMANVSGFGWIRGNKLAKNLQSVEVPLIDFETCNEAYAYLGGVPEGYICSASSYTEGGKNACRGDEGGPLTIDGRLAGIVSFIVSCDDPRYPTLYTEVAYYRDWIDQHLGH